ncbi:tyrosine-protein kinase Fer-like, partial [Seriola lalandi dorsalis]|uniref:tyrosine-protein kinase Fer-like n=1 Tax=Seriola lalandi dorsalis TaxID=1841481 RepID=UPI000C6F59C1
CVFEVGVFWRSTVTSAVCVCDIISLRLCSRSILEEYCDIISVCLCSRSILEEYCDISSLLTEEIVKVHQEISAAVQQIDPLAEYQHFIDAYRSPETPEPSVEFDTSLLEETDNLPANEILWNTLTADSLQAMLSSATEELTLTQQNLRTKEA